MTNASTDFTMGGSFDATTSTTAGTTQTSSTGQPFQQQQPQYGGGPARPGGQGSMFLDITRGFTAPPTLSEASESHLKRTEEQLKEQKTLQISTERLPSPYSGLVAWKGKLCVISVYTETMPAVTAYGRGDHQYAPASLALEKIKALVLDKYADRGVDQCAKIYMVRKEDAERVSANVNYISGMLNAPAYDVDISLLSRDQFKVTTDRQQIDMFNFMYCPSSFPIRKDNEFGFEIFDGTNWTMIATFSWMTEIYMNTPNMFQSMNTNYMNQQKQYTAVVRFNTPVCMSPKAELLGMLLPIMIRQAQAVQDPKANFGWLGMFMNTDFTQVSKQGLPHLGMLFQPGPDGATPFIENPNDIYNTVNSLFNQPIYAMDILDGYPTFLGSEYFTVQNEQLALGLGNIFGKFFQLPDLSMLNLVKSRNYEVIGTVDLPTGTADTRLIDYFYMHGKQDAQTVARFAYKGYSEQDRIRLISESMRGTGTATKALFRDTICVFDAPSIQSMCASVSQRLNIIVDDLYQQNNLNYYNDVIASYNQVGPFNPNFQYSLQRPYYGNNNNGYNY